MAPWRLAVMRWGHWTVLAGCCLRSQKAQGGKSKRMDWFVRTESPQPRSVFWEATEDNAIHWDSREFTGERPPTSLRGSAVASFAGCMSNKRCYPEMVLFRTQKAINNIKLFKHGGFFSDFFFIPTPAFWKGFIMATRTGRKGCEGALSSSWPLPSLWPQDFV